MSENVPQDRRAAVFLWTVALLLAAAAGVALAISMVLAGLFGWGLGDVFRRTTLVCWGLALFIVPGIMKHIWGKD